MRPIIESEIQHIAFDIDPKDIQLPVYSFYDQCNYQEFKGKLAIRMFEDLMLNTLYWDKAMQTVITNEKISHVLDFGPGKTTQRLSADTLQALGSEKPVLGLAKNFKAILN